VRISTGNVAIKYNGSDKITLELYPIRLEDWQIAELKRRADGHPVAPLIREIITGWLGVDDTLKKEQIQSEIKGLIGQINILNKQLENIEITEHNHKLTDDIEVTRLEYLKSHPEVLKMYQLKTIGQKGYQVLQSKLNFKNKSEAVAWLDEQGDVNYAK